jgi:hypothetical protein
VRGSKQEALQAVGLSLERLTADLAGLGAVALSAETERSPLTWSAHSAGTRVERDHNEKTGRYEPTGQVTATVDAFRFSEAPEAVEAHHPVRLGRLRDDFEQIPDRLLHLGDQRNDLRRHVAARFPAIEGRCLKTATGSRLMLPAAAPDPQSARYCSGGSQCAGR